MLWRVPTPVLSVPSGTFNAAQTVTVTNLDPEATMTYTLTGADPTPSDAPVTSSLTIDGSRVLKVKAFKPWAEPSETATAVYTLKPLPPTVTPLGGPYTSLVNVTLTPVTAGSTIRFTTTGLDPTDASTPYSGPIPIGTTTTLKAAAFKIGWSSSDVRTEVYSMTFGTLAPPVFTPAPGRTWAASR